MSSEEDLRAERRAVFALELAAEFLAPHLHCLWHWGDDEGGHILDKLVSAAERAGAPVRFSPPLTPAPRKAYISKALRKAVMERDAYRCVRCNSYIDLEPDHIIPEVRGGPTSLDNLQTLCRPCNLKKGARLRREMARGD